MAQGGALMRVYRRTDMPDAFIVQSGEETYHVYLGHDVSLPRCSCAAAIYTDTDRCKHIRAVKEANASSD